MLTIKEKISDFGRNKTTNHSVNQVVGREIEPLTMQGIGRTATEQEAVMAVAALKMEKEKTRPVVRKTIKPVHEIGGKGG